MFVEIKFEMTVKIYSRATGSKSWYLLSDYIDRTHAVTLETSFCYGRVSAAEASEHTLAYALCRENRDFQIFS